MSLRAISFCTLRLEQFQVAAEAWPVALELLMGSGEEVVLYFAAHTIVTKMQAGQLPQGVDGNAVAVPPSFASD
eukprot:6477832-Amphidinium_carterae.1